MIRVGGCGGRLRGNERGVEKEERTVPSMSKFARSWCFCSGENMNGRSSNRSIASYKRVIT